jgi:hypothetical protein
VKRSPDLTRYKWRWPSDDDINLVGLMLVIMITTLSSIANCVMDPIRDGHDPIYDDHR